MDARFKHRRLAHCVVLEPDGRVWIAFRPPAAEDHLGDELQEVGGGRWNPDTMCIEARDLVDSSLVHAASAALARALTSTVGRT